MESNKRHPPGPTLDKKAVSDRVEDAQRTAIEIRGDAAKTRDRARATRKDARKQRRESGAIVEKVRQQRDDARADGNAARRDE